MDKDKLGRLDHVLVTLIREERPFTSMASASRDVGIPPYHLFFYVVTAILDFRNGYYGNTMRDNFVARITHFPLLGVRSRHSLATCRRNLVNDYIHTGFPLLFGHHAPLCEAAGAITIWCK